MVAPIGSFPWSLPHSRQCAAGPSSNIQQKLKECQISGCEESISNGGNRVERGHAERFATDGGYPPSLDESGLSGIGPIAAVHSSCSELPLLPDLPEAEGLVNGRDSEGLVFSESISLPRRMLTFEQR
jgi:hypothetical protein